MPMCYTNYHMLIYCIAQVLQSSSQLAPSMCAVLLSAQPCPTNKMYIRFFFFFFWILSLLDRQGWRARDEGAG